MQNQKLISLAFAVAIIAAGISGAHISEIKVMGQQLHGVLISGGYEWVPGPNQFDSSINHQLYNYIIIIYIYMWV